MIKIAAVNNGHNLSGDLYDLFSRAVSPARRQKARRFLRREDACRCLLGEALARYCIAGMEKTAAGGIVFHYDEYGKPYVDTPAKTQFSISHSKAWVACAVDRGPVGLDVQHMHDIDMEIAGRFFSKEEYAAIIAMPVTARKDRFYDFWTLKEGYVKAIGKGLSCPFSSFTIHINDDRITMDAEQGMAIMCFKRYDLARGYKCALCAMHDDFPEHVELLTPEELGEIYSSRRFMNLSIE